MKWSKKNKAIGAFFLCAAIFTTTAIADVIIGSGYYRLKDTTKKTAATLLSEKDNFEADVSMNLKIDGEIFIEAKSNVKIDVVGNRMETNSYTKEKGKESNTRYSYEDSEKNITKNNEDTYYIREIFGDEKKVKSRFLTNPFQEEMTQDAEKIVDAFVGNLKDIVQVEEADGKKMYTANLTETQVPTLVNAVSSFVLKYSIMDNYNVKKLEMPLIKKDIYVRDASAKIVENKDGLIENGVGSVTMVGKDDKDIEHVFTLEFGGSVNGINSTVVTAPNLEGKEIEYVRNSGNRVSEKLIGKFKNNIVDETNGTFVKIGERTVEITSAADGVLTGRYYETYTDGASDVAPRTFDFTGESGNRYEIRITYTDSDGSVKNGVIYENGMKGQNISFQIGLTFEEDGSRIYHDDKNKNFDSEFFRVFE